MEIYLTPSRYDAVALKATLTACKQPRQRLSVAEADISHVVLYFAFGFDSPASTTPIPHLFTLDFMASSTAADPQEPSVTGPRAPFDDEDADLIIRCPDGAEFWVYKSILGRASPVFKGMSTLPPPPPDVQRDPSNQDYRDGVPVVHVSEDARTMELLLTFCYPMKDPQLTTFDDIRTVAEAGQKLTRFHSISTSNSSQCSSVCSSIKLLFRDQSGCR
ncbi:hypothetical protein A0H81_09200 [Grifola frondosa]|uniref:BTB domain-containing protein n=1 Tax=Grifola frondosa TaxID=5627 RepID=A0A1C7M761_GRIFR|nr:hypothetical protein A0H81_09200 [Grifola frondosa]